MMIRGPRHFCKVHFFAANKNILAPEKADMNPKNDASEDVVLLRTFGCTITKNVYKRVL